MAAVIQSPIAPASDSRVSTLYREEAASLSTREVLRLIVKSWPFIAAHRRMLALKCILSFTSLGFFLFLPWPMKIVIDNVLDGRPLTGIPRLILYPLVGESRTLLLAVLVAALGLVGLLIGTADDRPDELSANVESGGLDLAGLTANEANDGWSLWNGLFGLLEVWITLDLSQRINQSVRASVYDRFLRAPLKLYADQKIGDALFRVMHDSASVGYVLYNGILAPLLSISAFLMTVVILAAQFPGEPMIPLLAGLAFPVIALGSALLGRSFRDRSQTMRERGSEAMAVFEERVAQVQLIKAFGQEQRERAAVDAASWQSFSATLRILALILILALIVAPGAVLLIGATLYSLMSQVIAGRLTLGEVVLLGWYAMLLWRPMIILGSWWTAIQLPAAGLRRLHSVLDRSAEERLDGGAHPVAERIKELGFRGLSVSYGNAEPVLQHVTLTLRSGEIAALAGANGAGKSTLVFSIPRFIEPVAGAVTFNGIDAREFDLAALRRRIGFVFQHEALFSTTLAENIRYGRPEASDGEVAAAAAMAGAAEFIERLPHAYATRLGRRGTRLSVGQKQRIAIARAMLGNPDVLVLDEPAAPLDARAEMVLMRALRTIARDRIVLLIAHRPETLASCDLVHFIHDRTLLASGPHYHLLHTSAAYRSYLAMTATGPSV